MNHNPLRNLVSALWSSTGKIYLKIIFKLVEALIEPEVQSVTYPLSNGIGSYRKVFSRYELVRIFTKTALNY